MEQIVLTCACANELSIDPAQREDAVDASVTCDCGASYVLSVTRTTPGQTGSQ